MRTAKQLQELVRSDPATLASAFSAVLVDFGYAISPDTVEGYIAGWRKGEKATGGPCMFVHDWLAAVQALAAPCADPALPQRPLGRGSPAIKITLRRNTEACRLHTAAPAALRNLYAWCDANLTKDQRTDAAGVLEQAEEALFSGVCVPLEGQAMSEIITPFAISGREGGQAMSCNTEGMGPFTRYLEEMVLAISGKSAAQQYAEEREKRLFVESQLAALKQSIADAAREPQP